MHCAHFQSSIVVVGIWDYNFWEEEGPLLLLVASDNGRINNTEEHIMNQTINFIVMHSNNITTYDSIFVNNNTAATATAGQEDKILLSPQ